ncbi:MAG TPA: pyrroloquinoline quinone-dependent dehydrogenase [Alphaproteobacteria bacterium]|jgi:quinoprotein glucose dehydrogenase|nr:pyrroloquinoline quinone-dependent dehydrogenase [Alphaproteobacteria bacterium]
MKIGGFTGWIASLALACAAFTASAQTDISGPTAGWDDWGNTAGGLRYSPLTQITPQNVGKLKVAWTYHFGPSATQAKYPLFTLEVTPIIAEGRMYVCSNVDRVAALDPETGKEIWTHDPKVNTNGVYLHNCRGVTFYHDAQAAAGAECASRIFNGTLDGRLIALDAATGKPCSGFGKNGEVDLKADLGTVKPGEYTVPSPPVMAGDKVILGAGVLDNTRIDIAAGVVRAFDARTGELSWAWNPLPPDLDEKTLAPAGERYAHGTTNAWTVFSVDAEHGLVYVPTGNTSPDYFGGMRHGLDYYSNSLVALDVATGKVAWHFQTVHHDLWDYDLPSQPVLFDFPTAGGPVPAVAQSTKQGNIFILNRLTGEPLVPVEERPVPTTGAVPDETPSPTQPYVTNPTYDLYPGDLSAKDMWGFTFWDEGKCRDAFNALLYEGRYTPPSSKGTAVFPYDYGIMNWGGFAIDPNKNLLIVNTSRVFAEIKLVPRAEADARAAAGHPAGMPAVGTPYAYDRIIQLSPFGAPCNRPPWGTLVAIDLKAGKRAWEIPLGTTRDAAPFPIWLGLGVPSVGGPIVTASGLAFIAGTSDNFIRAFDVNDGKELWKERLPAGGQANPMTYRLKADGKQFVVIAAGGHAMMGTKQGDSLIAYTLGD